MEGSGDASHFTLDALNDPTLTVGVGGYTCHLPPASESGVWGKAPRACFFVFEVVRVDVTVQKKVKKNVHF